MGLLGPFPEGDLAGVRATRPRVGPLRNPTRGGAMGLGDMLDKGKDLAGDHADEAKAGVDKAADAVDSATGGKATGQIDTGADKAKDFIDDQKN